MRAIIVTDIQNDFLPGGALPVPRGGEVVPVANRLMDRFELVIATQDWHPPDHESFASRHPGRRVGDVIDLHGLEQVLWPDHCVQNTWGADFAPGLAADKIQHVVRKALDREIDSYSAFFDNGHRRATGMDELLRTRGVGTIYLVGLASDYCVKFTALDAVALGYRTNIILDGCRGIERVPGDIDRAVQEMRAKGVDIVTSDKL